jgi:serine protease Do
MKRNDDFERRPWFLVPVKHTSGNSRRWNVFWISVLAFLVIGIFVIASTPELGHAAAEVHKVPLKVDENPAPVNMSTLQNGYSSVIGPALPAVVNISSTKVVKHQNQMPEFFNDPMFRQFFGNPNGHGHSHGDEPEGQGQAQTEREHSLGSGVIVNPNGYILTNNHVIDGASDIEVFTQDKKKFHATLVGTDPRTDIAVLKVEATELPSLTIGDSKHLKVGDVVFAVGDPFGVGETATMGIVSATGRGFGGKIEHYENFIQTDAAINPGNSGGALLDIHGDLVGINTAIITGDNGGGNLGIGLAIPVDMARNVMEQIVDHGKVVRGQLGVAVQTVDANMAKAFGLTQGGGALVAQVLPGSPAAKAGIERGDIILDLNGQPVGEPDELSVNVSQMAPGTTVHLKISRNGQMKNVDVTLNELSEKEEASANGESKDSAALQGVQVQNLTPAIAEDLGISSGTQGVVITSVDSSSAASGAGLNRGDVIQEINRKPVHNVEEYQHALSEKHGQSTLLLINRGGTTHYIVVQPQ